MKTYAKNFLSVMLIYAMIITTIPALAAGTPPPLSIGSEPQVAAERLIRDGSVWVSLSSPLDMEAAINYRSLVQAYVDAVSSESETPVVRMTLWKKTDDNRAEMVLGNTSEASQFPEEELEKICKKAGDTVVEINKYIRKNLTYDSEAAADGKRLKLSSPQVTAKGGLSAGKAVCQGYANLFSLLADQAGIESVKVRGYVGDVFHVMNVVRTDDGNMVVDTTVNDSWGKDWALLVPLEEYCKKVNFHPIIDPEIALTMKYGEKN